MVLFPFFLYKANRKLYGQIKIYHSLLDDDVSSWIVTYASRVFISDDGFIGSVPIRNKNRTICVVATNTNIIFRTVIVDISEEGFFESCSSFILAPLGTGKIFSFPILFTLSSSFNGKIPKNCCAAISCSSCVWRLIFDDGGDTIRIPGSTVRNSSIRSYARRYSCNATCTWLLSLFEIVGSDNSNALDWRNFCRAKLRWLAWCSNHWSNW